MAASKNERLARLAKLQHRLKALHETRQAIHRKEAAAAEQEAAELAKSFDTPDSLSALFPELYNKQIGRALARREQSLAGASREAEKTTMADARATIAERAYRKARNEEERVAEERGILEVLQQRLKPDD
ncbi:hypothetical protein [Chelativorans sp. YIM 93263]|uniref:hypothetical protein n=1 Tax=Chelativorans sp. YIM 93263 TaxID=2906648 RepID=UPI0023783CF1|nr:hypothetical protein [Chelativorans sp. YIM 93263]